LVSELFLRTAAIFGALSFHPVSGKHIFAAGAAHQILKGFGVVCISELLAISLFLGLAASLHKVFDLLIFYCLFSVSKLCNFKYLWDFSALIIDPVSSII